MREALACSPISLGLPWVESFTIHGRSALLTSYQVFFAIGILVAYVAGRRVLVGINGVKSRDYDLFFGVTLAMVVSGAGLASAAIAIATARQGAAWSEIIAHTGYGSFGGIAGAALSTLIVRRLADPGTTSELLDAVAIAGAAGMGIGRIGCLTSGCCYGTPTEFLGVIYEAEYYAPIGKALVPIQGFEAIVLLSLSVLLFRAKKKGHVGVWLPFIATYASWRFAAEFFRGEPDHSAKLIAGLNGYQIVAITVTAAALAVIVSTRARRSRRGVG